jgi:hypothetical protein
MEGNVALFLPVHIMVSSLFAGQVHRMLYAVVQCVMSDDDGWSEEGETTGDGLTQLSVLLPARSLMTSATTVMS